MPSAESLNCRKFLWSCISCRQYEGKNFVKPSCYVKSHFTFFTFLQRAIPSSPAGRFFFLNFGAPPSGASSIALPCSHSAGGFASPPSFSHGNLLYQPQKAHSSKVTSSIQCTPIAYTYRPLARFGYGLYCAFDFASEIYRSGKVVTTPPPSPTVVH